jgi:hypothetical protein
MTLLTVGYAVSFLLTGVGWLLVGLRLHREPSVARRRVRLLLVGAVLMVAPLPGRWFLVALAVSLLAAAEQGAVPARTAAVPVTG